jgi:5'-methylthioadenosine phosphorylase
MIVPRLGANLPVLEGKVYVQMRGPRFETKAEIKIIRHWGDVVGMTAAGEADLCREIGLHYNSFAIIDNYANGLMNDEIDFEKFRELVKANQQKVNRLFTRLLEILG